MPSLPVYAIANGIGLIVYALGKILSGRVTQLHPVVVLLAALFVVKFAFLRTGRNSIGPAQNVSDGRSSLR